MEETSCPKCGETLEQDDAFCQSCGHKRGEAVPTESPAIGAGVLQRHRNASTARSARWLMYLSILFVIFGTGYGFYYKSQADDALQVLQAYDDSDILEVEGEQRSVGDLKKQIKREVWLLFGLNYFLAAIMLGLFFWAKTNPLGAMVTGLCVYLAVIVLNAVIDPKTLAQGLLIKALFIGAMIGGIKSALQDRDEAAMA